MLDIIKTSTICGTFHLTLIYFETINGYEVQYGNDDKMLDTDGIYSTKREGLKAYNRFLKSLIVEVQQ